MRVDDQMDTTLQFKKPYNTVTNVTATPKVRNTTSNIDDIYFTTTLICFVNAPTKSKLGDSIFQWRF